MSVQALAKSITQDIVKSISEGGPGSGNWHHKGIKGHRGGSMPGGGHMAIARELRKARKEGDLEKATELRLKLSKALTGRYKKRHTSPNVAHKIAKQSQSIIMKKIGSIKSTPAKKETPKTPKEAKKVIVWIEPKMDKRFKSWAKVLQGVNTKDSTGYAFKGEFIKLGQKHELPDKTLILRYDQHGSRNDHRPAINVAQVTPKGLETLFYREKVGAPGYGAGWALDVRNDIAKIAKKHNLEVE